MTIFKGLFLFDIAEPSIGQWENQLGYRGMMEVWKIQETQDFVCIEPWDDICERHRDQECTCWEAWLGNDKTGDCDTLGIWESFDKADQEAKKWMNENPNGWN